jgi:hypothetical protein
LITKVEFLKNSAKKPFRPYGTVTNIPPRWDEEAVLVSIFVDNPAGG